MGHANFRVFSSFAVSQATVFSTSIARIPLVVAAVGSDGYGVAVAVSSLQAWMMLIILSVTHLTQVSVSEDIGRDDLAGAEQTIVEMRHRARLLMGLLALVGLVLSVALPWLQVLHAQKVSGELTLRISIFLSMLLLASSAPGAVYVGVLNAEKRVALTQSLPGIAAVASLVVTAIGWKMHLGIIAFIIAPAVASCTPFWIAPIWGRGSLMAKARRRAAGTIRTERNPNARGLRPRDFLILTGVAAPPLFSTGLDPIVLSISRGPTSVAAYGLATRLGALVVMLPAALYPIYWSNFSRLRAAGDLPQIFALYRKELKLVVSGTVALGLAYVAIAPTVASVLSSGKIERPALLYVSIAALGVLAAVQTVTLPLLAGTKTAPKMAFLVFGFVVPNEALSYGLSREVGAAGPILASIVATIALLGICAVIVKRNPNVVIDQPRLEDGVPWQRGMADALCFGGPLVAVTEASNGVVANHAIANGAMTNGAVTNGAVTNGAVTKGALRNGSVANGAIANGFATNGSAKNRHATGNGSRANGALTVLEGQPPVGPSEGALDAKRRWSRATWFGVVTFFAWSPFETVNKLLPNGSSTRGVVLTLIPLIGVIAVKRLPKWGRRSNRFDLLAVMLIALIVWQAISVATTTGTSYVAHVVPGAALLLLAGVARGQVNELSLADIRFAMKGVLLPLCSLLIIGWIAQFAHLVPVPSGDGSALGFSVNGNRLEGLTSGPNLLGFLTVMIILIAFVAKGGVLPWFTRIVGILTLFATDSRTSMIVLAIGLLMLWVFGPERTLTARLVPLATLVVGAAGLYKLIDKQRAANTDVLSNRDTIWHDLVPYLHHLPVFGYGPDFLQQLVPLVFGPFAITGQILDPQNQWLNDSLVYGYPSAILLTVFLFVLPIRGTSTFRRMLLFPLLAMVLVEGFSEVPLSVFASIDGAFPLFLLFMWAPLRSTRQRQPVSRMKDVEGGQYRDLDLLVPMLTVPSRELSSDPVRMN